MSFVLHANRFSFARLSGTLSLSTPALSLLPGVCRNTDQHKTVAVLIDVARWKRTEITARARFRADTAARGQQIRDHGSRPRLDFNGSRHPGREVGDPGINLDFACDRVSCARSRRTPALWARCFRFPHLSAWRCYYPAEFRGLWRPARDTAFR